MQLPSFSAKKDEIELMQMPKTYPAKYTYNYVKQITPTYKVVGKDQVIYVALDMLKGTNGEFSRNAILGNNLSGRPVKIEFRDLGIINPDYAKFDALGWKKINNYLFILTLDTKTHLLELWQHYYLTKLCIRMNTIL